VEIGVLAPEFLCIAPAGPEESRISVMEFGDTQLDGAVKHELTATEMSQVHDPATVVAPRVAPGQAPPWRVFYSGAASRPGTAWAPQFLAHARQLYRGSSDGEGELVKYLREQITHAVHLGHLRTGDRLPSIREIAREFGATHHAVVQAYDALSMEGLVEKRGRSGVYLAKQEGSGAELGADAARWLAGVLAGACEQGIRIPHLPELLRCWTASVRLRCACIDSDGDHRTAFCAEIGRQFGLDTHGVPVDCLPVWEPGREIDLEMLPVELRQADVLVTTVFHAPAVRALGEMLGRRVVVATANPEMVETIERRLCEERLTIVCVDSAFPARLRSLCGGKYRDRIHVVLADDTQGLAEIDRTQPVLLTRAAHEKLGTIDFRLLVPHSPSFSPAFERDLSEVIILLNLEASRP
jgi:DNA-binding transcriptional regulator YhcF (GntR family)